MKTYILRATQTVEPQKSNPHLPPPLLAGRVLFIGLDVHNDSIAVSLAPSDSTEVRRYGIIGGEHDDVLKLVKKLQAAHPGTLLKFCYEAGPRGFALCRCLRSHGLDCLLVCPSKVPRKPGERVKTDRRGRERDGSPPPPAPLTGRQPTHNHRMKSFGASAPDARPPKTGAPAFQPGTTGGRHHN